MPQNLAHRTSVIFPTNRPATLPRSRRYEPDSPWLRVRAGSLDGVQLTLFWDRMNAQFGAAYAQSVAKDYVFSGLGGRTVERALADGEDAKVVWRAVCEVFDVPDRLR
jgi:hypothetical protein